MCSAPDLSAQAVMEAECASKGYIPRGDLQGPQNVISILTAKSEGYFISMLSASLHGLRRNIFICYLHYYFLHSNCMQTNPLRTTDIKVVHACPGNSLQVLF